MNMLFIYIAQKIEEKKVMLSYSSKHKQYDNFYLQGKK